MKNARGALFTFSFLHIFRKDNEVSSYTCDSDMICNGYQAHFQGPTSAAQQQSRGSKRIFSFWEMDGMHKS